MSIAVSPATSQAYTVSNYCNNFTLNGGQYCEGAQRSMYAVEGWGDQHSVCVFINFYGEFYRKCSGGPGEHVYDPFGQTLNGWPGIQNQGFTSNVVHGRAYQP
jgi:hypothetical protein